MGAGGGSVLGGPPNDRSAASKNFRFEIFKIFYKEPSLPQQPSQPRQTLHGLTSPPDQFASPPLPSSPALVGLPGDGTGNRIPALQ